MEQQREAAKKAMISWLADEHELGKEPSKIECVNEFDLHDLHYYVFRFKKGMFGDWLLGVAGGYEKDSNEHCGHVFSNMEKYDSKTAVDASIEMVEKIRAYWMNEAKKIQFQQSFQQNLKYISQTEISAEDIEKQFVRDGKHYYMQVGKVDFPSGRIVVADPLAYLPSNKYSPELEISIPSGVYPVDVSICLNKDIGIRMCTTRLKVKDTKAIKYICAASTPESTVASNDKENISGFPVDAGMMTICDAKVADEYREFLDKWYAENPDKNHYDDYFAAFFAQSYERFPSFQREGGDFIQWTNPIYHHNMVMVAAGLGDGFYQSYIGYDENEQICEIIVPMINPDLFEDDDENTNNFIPNEEYMLVTKSLLDGTSKLKWMFREIKNNPLDSGWMAIGDSDTQEYLDQAENLTIVDFNTFANIEPSILKIYNLPVGTDLEFRNDNGKKYFIDNKTGKPIN